MTFEICMPTHISAQKIISPFNSLLKQTYKDFYITIFDNTPIEYEKEIVRMKEVIAEYREKGLTINFIKNEHNLGYAGNIKKIFAHFTGDICMLLADDDILACDAIEKFIHSFQRFPNAKAVCRSYYWFLDDMHKAVRFQGAFSSETVEVNLDSNVNDIYSLICSTAQVSALAFNADIVRNYSIPDDVFTAHIWPIMDILKHHSAVFLNEPMLAVSISTSQCHSGIYANSPVSQYYRMYSYFLSDPKHKKLKQQLMKKMTRGNLVGFAQIKNYGTLKQTLREIYLYAKYYKRNLLDPVYYIFAFGVLIIPRCILIPLIDFYKNKILAKKIQRSIKIDYSRF